MTVDRSIERIRAFAAQHKMRPARLAKAAGLHQNTLRGFNRPGWNPTLETVRRIESIIPPEFGISAATDGEAA